jgi:hypothetical protein
VVTNGSSKVPRARETAGASSHACCRSIGDRGSVSVVRRVAVSCCLARCSCRSSLSWWRGAGKVTLLQRWRDTASLRLAAGSWQEVVVRVGGHEHSWMRQKTADWALVWHAPQLSFRFGAPLGSRRQGPVPFPKRVRGGGSLFQVDGVRDFPIRQPASYFVLLLPSLLKPRAENPRISISPHYIHTQYKPQATLYSDCTTYFTSCSFVSSVYLLQ